MKDKKGFTLLELLVVILIIGILAGIALPQYKKAIWKSRASTLYTQINAIGSAIQRYYLVHGSWAHEFDDLDIDIPGESIEGTVCSLANPGGKSLIQGDNFALKIQGSPHNTIYGLFTSGPYSCSGLMYNTEEDIFCVEIIYNNLFSGTQGDFCEKVMNYSFSHSRNGVDRFTK